MSIFEEFKPGEIIELDRVSKILEFFKPLKQQF